jgi:uncharacterized protein (DUF2267 family)
MTLRPAVWYPIAVALSAINLLAIGFALRPTPEPAHAAAHAALAVVFGLWAQRLVRRRSAAAAAALPAEFEALEFEVNQLRQELSETQERMDFFERVLTQSQEKRRVGPEKT